MQTLMEDLKDMAITIYKVDGEIIYIAKDYLIMSECFTQPTRISSTSTKMKIWRA